MKHQTIDMFKSNHFFPSIYYRRILYVVSDSSNTYMATVDDYGNLIEVDDTLTDVYVSDSILSII